MSGAVGRQAPTKAAFHLRYVHLCMWLARRHGRRLGLYGRSETTATIQGAKRPEQPAANALKSDAGIVNRTTSARQGVAVEEGSLDLSAWPRSTLVPTIQAPVARSGNDHVAKGLLTAFRWQTRPRTQ